MKTFCKLNTSEAPFLQYFHHANSSIFNKQSSEGLYDQKGPKIITKWIEGKRFLRDYNAFMQKERRKIHSNSKSEINWNAMTKKEKRQNFYFLHPSNSLDLTSVENSNIKQDILEM